MMSTSTRRKDSCFAGQFPQGRFAICCMALLRSEKGAPLIGIAGRAERALRNYLEIVPFFADAILAVAVTNTHSWLTVWGAHFYFWSHRLRNPVAAV
jgi:MAPEG family